MVTGESKNGPPSERLLDVPVGEANRFKSPLGFRRPEMASLIWDRSLRLGHSKRNSFSSVAYDSAAINMSSSSTTSSFTGTTNSLSAALPSPFGDVSLSDADLRASAYEIFLAATRSSSSKPLIYTSNNQNNNNCIKQRWSLTSTATSKMNVWKTTLPRLPKKDNLQSSPPRLTMKKALGLRSSSKRGSEGRSPGSSCSGGKIKKPMTVGELMRVQMRVSDALDSRLRRGLLRISAGQVGKRIESMVLPLELLQQFKAITTIPDAPIPIYIFGFLPFHKEQDLEPACSINPNTLFFQYTLKIISSPFFLFLKWSISQQILSSTLTAMLGWADKRLLAYHGTFDSRKIDSIQSIVSIGISAAKILVEDISNDVDEEKTKLMSSVCTAFARRMEKADSNRRSSRNQLNSLPVLAILAKDVGDLAMKGKDTFSPILKRWHPFAVGVAVAMLHACYGNELKQFIAAITELTADAVQILRAADKLEKDLINIAVEDSVDSDDGGKAIICEMPPYEAEGSIANMVKVWIKTRINRLKECIDRTLQQEVYVQCLIDSFLEQNTMLYNLTSRNP
ncbi:Hypothetical predicted protein [Olea europaea subsp. europaea]|uniref:MHD1 domain-containing protein n=1 Tax=Olea europaea subsp. europaea TaxID=158383 RepID=A0A8S0PIJ1_OLEEU|nr:Hypothetical predicted protein [Olea europaea subsp. europaea]